MKATHGLVPYTGVMPIEATIDHTGPMTTTVGDNALLLEVIAGADGLDPRQYDVQVEKYSYTTGLGRGVSGMRIAMVTESFGWPSSEPDVDAKVREAAERLRAAGAIVEPVSNVSPGAMDTTSPRASCLLETTSRASPTWTCSRK